MNTSQTQRSEKSACFEGYKRGDQQGYGLTLRQIALEFIKANIAIYNAYFDDLAAYTLSKWGERDISFASRRQLLRVAAQRALDNSLDCLLRFGARMAP